jgi:hypothetical protein
MVPLGCARGLPLDCANHPRSPSGAEGWFLSAAEGWFLSAAEGRLLRFALTQE